MGLFPQDVFVWLEDGKIILSSKATLPSSVDNSSKIYEMATQNPISMYLDADHTIDMIPSFIKRQYAPIYDDAKLSLKGIEVVANQAEGNAMRSEISLLFDEEDRNGLCITP